MGAGAGDDLSGTTLGGRYRIVRKLGQGGMGAVYEAVQEGLHRHVAVKVLHPHLAGESVLLRRFQREANAAAALGHPHIVLVTDFHHEKGEPPFLVMEYLAGDSLRSALARDGKMPAPRVARIMTQVLSALSAAHRAQIVHRDVKPDNIFLAASSAVTDLVKVLDFGVVKLLGEDGDTGPLTVAGAVLGTLSYMAPEQARGRDVDGRTDLYAVAACMYVACSGRRPIEAPDMGSLIGAILTQDPAPLATLCPDVDPEFAAIVDRGLKKDPQDRFESADAMERALQAWLAKVAGPDSRDAAAKPPAASSRTDAASPQAGAPPPVDTSPRAGASQAARAPASSRGGTMPHHAQPPLPPAGGRAPTPPLARPATPAQPDPASARRPPPPGPTLPAGPSPAAWLPVPATAAAEVARRRPAPVALWIGVGVGALALLGIAGAAIVYAMSGADDAPPAATTTTHAVSPAASAHVEPATVASTPAAHATPAHASSTPAQHHPPRPR